MKLRTMLRRDFVKTWGVGALGLSLPVGSLPLEAQQRTPEIVADGASAGGRSVTEDLAAWVADLKYEDLPPVVIAKAKQLLLDTLGCAIGAADGGPVRMAQQMVTRQGGNPQATVIGVGWRTSCEQAAFLNAMAIRYLDYNDYAAFGFPHHPSINVAAALAAAEMQGLTGKDLILGLTVAYDVHIRFRDVSVDDGPTQGARQRGFDLPSIEAQYASAAAVAKLLGLDASGIAHALAIAGSFATTLREVRSGGELGMAKGCAEAIAQKNGTFSALLASAGIKYPMSVLDGQRGYGKVIVGALDDEILRTRSGDFHILKSCNKMWPSIGISQAPIAAALQIRSQNVLPDDIETISLALSDFGYEQAREFLGEINTREHADHSPPYLVTRAFLDGNVRVDDFEESRFRDPRALEFMRKVVLRTDASLAGDDKVLGAIMEVTLRDGTVRRVEMPYAPGSVLNPAGDEGLMQKFLLLSEPSLGAARARTAAQVILSVDELSDLSELLDAVSSPSSQG